MSDRRDRLEAFYAPLAAVHSPARRVGWESDEAHALRLGLIVSSLEPLDAVQSVLDVGAGEGALVGLLRARGYTGGYQGEDLLPDMVARAAALHPGEAFRVHDLMAPGPDADVVVLSGALNTWQADDQDAAAHQALTTLWARARTALVLDVAVRDRHPAGPGVHPVDLAALWQHARGLGALVSIREDGVPGEALLVLRRDRRATLEQHLPGPEHATARATLLLDAREPAAARDTLLGLATDDAELLRARAHLALGRLRDADKTLTRLAHAGHPAARLHLGALSLATGRQAEGEALLTAVAACADPLADDARLILARHYAARGDRPRAAALASAIVDPMIAREAAALASKPPAAD